jgi:hypothetical protein
MATLNIGLYPRTKRADEARNIADALEAKGFEVTIVSISEENDLDFSINGVMFCYRDAERQIESLLKLPENVIPVSEEIHDNISELWSESPDKGDGDLGG